METPFLVAVTPMKELGTFTEPQAFLRLVQRGMEAREAENSLMLGVLLDLCNAPPIGAATPVLISVRDRGSWSLAAVVTPPFPLILVAASSRIPAEELALLGEHLHRSGAALSGVVAASELAEAFARVWTGISGCRVRDVVRQRIYRSTTVADIRSPPGELRRATPADLELVGRWFAEFYVEALNQDDPRPAHQIAEQRIRRREVYLWEDSEPRSILARGRPTRNTISVNAVYTPPLWRRQGLATAAVASLSRELLAEGYSMCVLYTDLSNPTSNGIYQRIGYEPVSDSDHFFFEPSRDTGC